MSSFLTTHHHVRGQSLPWNCKNMSVCGDSNKQGKQRRNVELWLFSDKNVNTDANVDVKMKYRKSVSRSKHVKHSQ